MFDARLDTYARRLQTAVMLLGDFPSLARSNLPI